MPYIDLHVHSTYSDGTDTPSELVEKAAQIGLSAFALTDHDTTAGFAEAFEAQKKYAGSLRIIPGVEISANLGKRDIHILGLNIDPTDETLVSALNLARENRDRRNLAMLERFRDAGFDISFEDLVSCEGGSAASITRAHFARALTAKGYAKDNADAFKKYLDFDKPFYIPREFMEKKTAVELILGAGGIPILAHPLLYGLSRKETEELINELCGYGLCGIEAIYSAYSGEEEQYLKSVAHRKGLKISGGTDYHGLNKPYLKLGTGRGNMHIPEEILTNLLEN